jgi:8-oxo-dGTP pyrophosphatase MutT (NUDIX family)
MNILKSDPSTQPASEKTYFHKKRMGKVVRSGTIILNFRSKKVLIIQSYGKFWGLPKGQKEENETSIECAIRETYEETGIQLSKDDLLKCYSIYNGDGLYYIVDGTNLKYDTTKINNKEEITGICWLCTRCIKTFIDEEKINI